MSILTGAVVKAVIQDGVQTRIYDRPDSNCPIENPSVAIPAGVYKIVQTTGADSSSTIIATCISAGTDSYGSGMNSIYHPYMFNGETVQMYDIIESIMHTLDGPVEATSMAPDTPNPITHRNFTIDPIAFIMMANATDSKALAELKREGVI